MRVRIPLVVAAAAAATSSLPLAGQEVVPPAPSESRLRATMRVPAGLEYVGVLESWDAQSMSLGGPGAPAGPLELSDMAKLEVSRGMKGNAGRGALIGAGVGLVGGFLAGILFNPDHDEYGLVSLSVAAGTWLGATALGTVIGAFVRTEEWQELPLPGR